MPCEPSSIVDRTSFAVMRRLGIDQVASLDEHFSVFRFGAKRAQSFHVVR
jgi:predicted nucleic acid-binding protein